MNLQTIHEHTIDLDLLSGGICIDAGCRGFQFSEAMRDLGLEVWAYDIENMVPPIGVIFNVAAITDKAGLVNWVDTKDQQAKHVSERGDKQVMSITLNDVYSQIADFIFYNNELKKAEYLRIDLLKLDIEGSEYGVLSDPNFQPIAKQLSIEWHMHCHRAQHDQYYDKCMENLLKWYVPVQHELTQAHGAGLNFWDSLFIRRDLIKIYSETGSYTQYGKQFFDSINDK